MKKLFLVVIMVLFLCGTVLANGSGKEEKDDGPKSICPKTLMKENCFICHVAPTFEIKEKDPGAGYDYPDPDFHFIFEDGKPVKGYFLLETISASELQRVLEYMSLYRVNHLVLEVFSPGGSLLDGYKMVGLMRHWRLEDNTIETHCYGFAASAGLLVFVSGSPGYRYAAPQAELMWHELWTLEGFRVSTPSGKEDEAKVLRHLQDTANSWLAEVSKLSKEEIDELVHKKELWINGVEAVNYGFADGLLGDK